MRETNAGPLHRQLVSRNSEVQGAKLKRSWRSMARQWLRKADADKWQWKADNLLDSSAVAGCRPAMAAELLAKVFLLVFASSIFLLTALHVLHSGGEFDKNGAPRKCVHGDGPNTVSPEYFSPDSANVLTLKNESAGPTNVRRFETYGAAVHLFIKMSAYRGGPNTFAIIGLEAKNPAELYDDPPYECVWVPAGGPPARARPVRGRAFKMLPDVGNVYSRLYSAVTINCTFPRAVGADRRGGRLVLYAGYGGPTPREPERVVALTEVPGEFPGADAYTSPVFKYEHVYCGSPLFGNLSPQRIREWVAYHVHFFGPRSHFFIYDAGGVHPAVRRVLDPWIAAGRVTLDDIREQEKFDGYYHNQFMVVNDCFHRARHLSRWLFFFDVDEYMWLPSSAGTLASVLAGFEDQTQIIIWQKPMSRNLCVGDQNAANDSSLASKWGFEKLVFRNIRKRESNDCKYAIQARRAMATGIHRSGHLIGGNATVYAGPLKYYHYHNTINRREEVCQEMVDPADVNGIVVTPGNKEDTFVYDGGMAALGERIKEFERNAVGPQPFVL